MQNIIWSRPKAILTRFRRDKEGVAALEFALVAGPFLFILLAIMEIALVMWQSELLEKGVQTASRKIYTGEFQTANAGQTIDQLKGKVKAAICDEVSALVACADIDVDVRQVDSFTASPPSPINGGTYDASGYNYKAIGSKQIGLVTASFVQKTIFPALSGTKLSNGDRVIMSTAAFMTEPY